MDGSDMRPRALVLTLTLICLLGAACVWAAAGSGSVETPPSKAGGSAEPRFELRGDWRFGSLRYRFSGRAGRMEGASRALHVIGECRLDKGTRVFRGFRFAGVSDGHDVWNGKRAVVRRDCSLRLIRSTVTVIDDLRFSERSGGEKSVFRRIRPKVRPSDPVVGAWVRNDAGIVVSAEGRRYEGRAREAFRIANGCVVAAGTLIWAMRPTAPGRYEGSIPTFQRPPGCEPGARNGSSWRVIAKNELERQTPTGEKFTYARG